MTATKYLQSCEKKNVDAKLNNRTFKAWKIVHKWVCETVENYTTALYARQQNASRVLPIVNPPSVCLSVCPFVCHTAVLCQNGAS